MEVKINKEIRNYTEVLFFGLSLRQCIFSALAVLVASALFFFMRPVIGTEGASWLSVLGAAPFAALGFVTYHGMTAEQFMWTVIKSEFLLPKRLRFHETNLYWEAINSAKNTETVEK